MKFITKAKAALILKEKLDLKTEATRKLKVIEHTVMTWPKVSNLRVTAKIDPEQFKIEVDQIVEVERADHHGPDPFNEGTVRADATRRALEMVESVIDKLDQYVIADTHGIKIKPTPRFIQLAVKGQGGRPITKVGDIDDWSAPGGVRSVRESQFEIEWG